MPADPLQHIKSVRRVNFVIKAGRDMHSRKSFLESGHLEPSRTVVSLRPDWPKNNVTSWPNRQ